MRKLIPIMLLSMLSAGPFDWFLDLFTITEEQRIEGVRRGDRAAHYTPMIMTEATHYGPDGIQIKGKTRPLPGEVFYRNTYKTFESVDPDAPSHLNWDEYLEWVNNKHETSN